MKRILVPLLVLAVLCMSLPVLAEGNVLKFEKNAGTVFEGETLQTVLTRTGSYAEGEVIYESSNLKAATVDGSGVVTGVSKGQSTITATLKLGGKTYRTRMTVTVARKAASVETATGRLTVFAADDPTVAPLLSSREDGEESRLPVLVLPVKKNVELQAVVYPKDATSRKFVLSVDNEEVVRVRNHALTGLQEGEAILTVASDLSPEVNERFRVLVVNPVTRLQPSASAPSVAVGEQMTLSVEAQPADATITRVTWASQDERIATVDENGVVTGVKRGSVRMVATVQDGSSVRANISVRVTQKATGIQLVKPEVTVDIGRNTVLHANVLPRDTDDKAVLWSSSDPSVATVNNQGRVTAVGLGDCTITCTSRSNPQAQADAIVHVQQPVKKITFTGAAEVYMGETAKLSWTVEPANATNPAVKLTSSNPRIVTVDPDGTIHPVKVGTTSINAVSTDGSNRRARVQVKVLQHVEGVRMIRRIAYIDVGETATAGAKILPENASNKHMSWVSANTDIAKVSGDTNRVRITGKNRGDTTVTGTTQDGGFQTSIQVKIGDWDHALRLRNADYNGDAKFWMNVENVSDLTITRVTAKIYFYETTEEGKKELAVNSKDGSNVITAVWKSTLSPGDATGKKTWTMQNYKAPSSMQNVSGDIYITSYEIDYDWIKTIRQNHRPHRTW